MNILLKEKIEQTIKARGRCILGIDGPCGSGKTTLAASLQKEYDAIVIHMDDFFLRPEQRTKERYERPGANVDYERFEEEVLRPLEAGLSFSYQKFDCSVMKLGEFVQVPLSSLYIIEGSYAMRPELSPYYDIRIYVHASLEERLRRIERRSPAKIEDFRNKWIPFENRYFSYYDIQNHCDFLVESTHDNAFIISPGHI